MATEMRMRAVFDCSADEPGELSFKENDILVDVTESGEDGWYSGRIENTIERGLFPYNYVERIDSKSIASTSTKEEKDSPEILTSIPITTTSANINIPTTSVKSATSTWGGKGSSTNNKENKNSLPGFPALDAFEAAMSSGKGAKASNTSTSWTPPAVSQIPPPIISPKPKLATPKDTATTGLGIKIIGQSTPPPLSEKPQLKSFGLNQDASPTRLRSWSTSSVSNNTNSEKALRPSQLLHGKGTKSALELALSKGSPAVTSKPQQSSNLRSNSFSKPGSSSGSNLGGIALPGMTNIKLNSSISNDVEEEDGFQMIKPSQLRQKQQQTPSPSPKPIISKSSASFPSYNKDNSKSATTTPSWGKSIDSSPTAKPSNSPKPSSSSKLEEVVSSNPMPRLPSRPTSTASRRSRNSRTSSINSSTNTSTNTTPSLNKANLPAVKETQNEKAPPPILKPKPQIAQPNLPPRPSNKSRSTSNPPPLQPKPAAMSSIEILLSKSAAEKKVSSLPVTTTSTTPPPRVSKPVNFQTSSTTNRVPLPGLTKPNSIPNQRPSLDSSWRSDTSTSTDDVNLKPSALLNRARSATNPTSNTDFTSMLMSKPTNTKPGITTTPRSAFTESPVPAASATSVIEVAKPINEVAAAPKKKATPPPPPPSRPPKNKTTVMDEASKHRYEVLFESMHDQGYVDGETARFIWLKSKLSNEELSKVWKECDPNHRGLLDKHSFIDGMGRIDELLLNKQQQVV